MIADQYETQEDTMWAPDRLQLKALSSALVCVFLCSDHAYSNQVYGLPARFSIGSLTEAGDI